MKRAAIYLRVSPGSSTNENQRPDCVRLAASRGFEVVAVYEERESGGKARPQFERMMLDAHAGQFDGIVVWALDRFDRLGILRRLMLIDQLDRYGVALLSVKETWIDSSPDNPIRELLIALSGWIDKQERVRRSERTKAGLARVRASGKKLGRPPTSFVKLAAAATAIRERGFSWRRACREYGVSQAALGRWLHDPRNGSCS